MFMNLKNHWIRQDLSLVNELMESNWQEIDR